MKHLVLRCLSLGILLSLLPACSASGDSDIPPVEATEEVPEPEPSIRELELVTVLDDILRETSGLLYLNGKILSHNDSGGAAELYEVDAISGNVLRTIGIQNATNRDWEDITGDSGHVYIADIGNNEGVRTDLTIYKIAIGDAIDAASSSVPAEQIRFVYSDQQGFEPAPFRTNFDAEALVSIGDSLYIFTKNWGNNRTHVYSLPREPGTYEAARVDVLDVQGLVTGADYDPATERLILLGYNFMVEVRNFTGNNFSGGDVTRYPLSVPQGNSTQTEGIIYADGEVYLSAEAFSEASQALYRIKR